jgi:hypothetical protein
MLSSNTKLTPSILQKHSFKAFLIKRTHQKRSRSKSDMQNQINPAPQNPTKITISPRAKTPSKTRIPPVTQQNTETPPTYPFPAYPIVKEQNDGTNFPVAKPSRLANSEANFKPAPETGGASVYSLD